MAEEHAAEDVQAARVYLLEQNVASKEVIDAIDDAKAVSMAVEHLDRPAPEPETPVEPLQPPAPESKPERHPFRDALEEGDIDRAVAAYDSLSRKLDSIAPSIQQASRFSEATLIQMGLDRVKGDFPQASTPANRQKLVARAASLVRSGSAEYAADPLMAFEHAAVLTFGGTRKPKAESDSAKRIREIKSRGSTEEADAGSPPEKKLSHADLTDKIGLLINKGKVREAEDLSRKYGILAE